MSPRRALVWWLVAGAVVALGGALALVAAAGRPGDRRTILRSGTPVTATVLASSGVPGLPDRVLVRYDVDDGRLLRRAVWVADAGPFPDRKIVEAAHDPRRPGRVAVRSARDPLPPYLAGLGGVLVLLGAALAARGVRAARRERRAAAKPGSPMRAEVWERRRGRAREIWLSLERADAVERERVWVRLQPGEDLSPLGAPDPLVTVGGTPVEGARVVVAIAGRTVRPLSKVREERPPGLAPLESSRLHDAGRGGRLPVRIAVALAVALVVVASVVIAGPGGAVLLSRSADRAAPACDQVERLLRGRSSRPDPGAGETADQAAILKLPRQMIEQPPEGFTPASSAPAYLSLDQAALTRRDPDEGRRVLTRYGYAGGYRRDFSRPDGASLVVFAFSFTSERNAAAFDAYAGRYLCAFAEQAFAIPDVGDAVGHLIQTSPERRVDQASFSFGKGRFLIGLVTPGTGAQRTPIEALTKAAHDRAVAEAS